MAKRKRTTTQAIIAKRLKEGRGKGTGANYKPWLTIQDVASLGRTARVLGMKTGRRHELLSQLEADCFEILDWAEHVVDIREQFPLLPLEETIEIAEQLGFAHPKDPKTGEQIVLTTDFHLTIQGSLGVFYTALTIKPSAELENPRVIEKFEIERCYYQKRNTSWRISTELDIPQVIVRNIKWFRNCYNLPSLSSSGLSDRDVIRAKRLLVELLNERKEPLTTITADCDDRLGFQPGQSLSLVRHMLARRELLVDISQPINPRKELLLLPAQSS
jgi:hypothetical protein